MYYPKALVTTDLYTSGAEYIDDSGNTYVGYYWQTYDGRYYKGKNPQDKTGGIPIYKIPETNYLGDPIINKPSQGPDGVVNLLSETTPTAIEYQQLQNTGNGVVYFPYALATVPTSDDYSIGSFRRYFCKRNNGEIYLEIDKNQFDRLSRRAGDILWQLYTPFSMFWKLTGDKQQVFQTNKNLTEQVINTRKYYRFADFLKNQYLLYYKE